MYPRSYAHWCLVHPLSHTPTPSPTTALLLSHNLAASSLSCASRDTAAGPKPSATVAAALVAAGAERYEPGGTSSSGAVARYASRAPPTSTGCEKRATLVATKEKSAALRKLSRRAARKRPVLVMRPGLKARTATPPPPHRLAASAAKSTLHSFESWYAFAPQYAVAPSTITAPPPSTAPSPERSPNVAPVAGSPCTVPPGASGSCTPEAVTTTVPSLRVSTGSSRLASRKWPMWFTPTVSSNPSRVLAGTSAFREGDTPALRQSTSSAGASALSEAAKRRTD
mmetsp:Transcript_24661/g.79650  ORF Transcript_24661/g.79650 Transcript_24661/m.79650 type:complete len:283 (-) Transcript_24661:317-1165(-)